MLPRPDTPLDQLRAAWDAKAERDALLASCPAQPTWTEAAFVASGTQLLNARLAPAIAAPLAEARRTGTALRVLDFGCGAGRLLGALRALDAVVAVHGVDVSPRMLARAEALVGKVAGIELTRNDGLTLQCLNRKSFQVAVCIDVLDHQPDTAWARYVLGQLHDKLAPGGILIADLEESQWPTSRLDGALAMLSFVPTASELVAGRRWLQLSRRAAAT